jgi:hypothetical protein
VSNQHYRKQRDHPTPYMPPLVPLSLVSSGIFALINLDDSSGIDLEEYIPFVRENRGMLLMGHAFLTHLREITLGGKTFWKERLEKMGGKERKRRKAQFAKRQKELRKQQQKVDHNHHHHHHHHHQTWPEAGVDELDIKDEDAWFHDLDSMLQEIQTLHKKRERLNLSAARRIHLDHAFASRYRDAFPSVFHKAENERRTKRQAELERTERTLRKAIPNTYWPSVKVNLSVVETSNDTSSGSKNGDDREECTSVDVPTSHPEKEKKSAFGWMTKKEHRGADSAADHNPPKAFEVVLSIKTEVTDHGGVWPNGSTLSQRVLLAEQMRETMIELESYTALQRHFEDGLRRQQHIAKMEFIHDMTPAEQEKQRELIGFSASDLSGELQLAKAAAQRRGQEHGCGVTGLVQTTDF